MFSGFAEVQTANKKLMKIKNIIPQIAALGLMATVAEGAVFRFHASGDWLDISNNGSGPEGWGPNPNNSGVLGSLPGGGDDARINWGGNTVTVSSTVPTVGRVQIGVDENGSVEVLSGGVLASNGHFFVGNNNVNVTNANLLVRNGGTVNVGNILYSSNNSSTGNITIDAGGVVNVANHLWLGATSASIISIGGTLTQTGGILGLGTTNASDPSGGSASLNILSGGLLELNNISGAAGTPSIQSGSVIDIQGTGLLTLPGDFVGSVNDYIAANKITGNGTNGAVSVVFDSNSNETIVTAIPEPSSALLLGLVGALGFIRRKR